MVAGLRAFGYYNAGQDCTAACRIYAGEKVYDNLVADLSAAVSTIRYDLADDSENESGRSSRSASGTVSRASSSARPN